ncbi:MAG: response regulator [Atopobiaceae bacterium]|nr:response regulator [Atopobiaceae bacterium]
MKREDTSGKNVMLMAVIGGVVILAVFLLGTVWSVNTAARETNDAVRSVSLLYLDELAGRREQVVASNLQRSIDDMGVAIELMDENDYASAEDLAAYQAQIRQLYKLEKFAFVSVDGTIYTSFGTQDNIEDYAFDHMNLTEPQISILESGSENKKVIIAMPVNIPFGDSRLTVCFMEKSMQEMLAGVSMESSEDDATFCNMYTSSGNALTNTVLGGLAVEDNLVEALEHAEFDDENGYDEFLDTFTNCRRGVVSFTYNGIKETLSYVPVEGTDWLLTYLIRESVLSDNIGSVTEGIVFRSVTQGVLTVLVLMVMFAFIIAQTRKNAQLVLESETAEAENRARNQELEQRLKLQDELLEERRNAEQQTKLITALASDYWSVFYIELDKNEGICYQMHPDIESGFAVGQHFPYLESFTNYANDYITDAYRDEFLAFVQPEAIREGLKKDRVISYRYTVNRHGREAYEMVRFAGVRHPEDRDDNLVHSIGASFTDVDAQTRASLEQNQALSDALAVAEEASLAKTRFLSNMSHEIRTPMNAIIGLDSIALNDPQTPDVTRDYLVKIGNSAEHLLNLINDILDMSRIESGRMTMRHEEFSLSELLEALNSMFGAQCQDKSLEYSCNVIGKVERYYLGDGMKLRQVLINILGNAVKFTPEGGSVSLSVERTAHFDGQTTLCFTVADTGIGMSEEFLPRLFDTFAQEDESAANRYGSSGLGLAITKSIVEMMNGNIQVQSTKGEGTTFYVTVTLGDVEHAADAKVAEVRPQDMSVLVVDDEELAREHAKLVLAGIGASCDLAESGSHAVEMVRVRHARRDPYDLILVDWKMPGMDGIETVRKIRSIAGNESAVVMLTAYRWDDAMDEAEQAGVDSFVSKPLFPEVVIDEYRAVMLRKGLLAERMKHKADLTGRRVLLAEDVEINAEIMVMVLQMREVETEVAENGKIAVEKFSASPVGYYDAVLMDMRMPEMGGLEATMAIRAMERADARSVPIIALTANAFDEDVQRSLQAGLDAHLSKPVEPDTLFQTLEELIKD